MTTHTCRTCKSPMGLRNGKYGLFYYCLANSKHRCVSASSNKNIATRYTGVDVEMEDTDCCSEHGGYQQY